MTSHSCVLIKNNYVEHITNKASVIAMREIIATFASLKKQLKYLLQNNVEHITNKASVNTMREIIATFTSFKKQQKIIKISSSKQNTYSRFS